MITKRQAVYLFIKSLKSDDMCKIRNINKEERSELIKAFNSVNLFRRYKTTNNKVIEVFKTYGFYVRNNKKDSTTTIYY